MLELIAVSKVILGVVKVAACVMGALLVSVLLCDP